MTSASLSVAILLALLAAFLMVKKESLPVPYVASYALSKRRDDVRGPRQGKFLHRLSLFENSPSFARGA